MNIRNLNIKDASSDALRALAQDIDVELQERDLAARKQIDPDFTNEQVFEDALTNGLTPEDASDPDWALMYEEWLSERDRKISMQNTGA